MIFYEENERAGNILTELEEAEKLTIDSGTEENVTFTQKCGHIYTIFCC